MPLHPSVAASRATAVLAGFVAASRAQDMPGAVLHDAKRTLLNHLAAAFGGCRETAIETLAGVLGSYAGTGVAALIGRRERMDILSAAFVNAADANVLDFCDTHLRTVIHPAAPVVPPLLALAQARALEGRPIAGVDLLHAMVLGVEIACRVGNAMSPGHYARGWHITSTCGGLGAAAATAKLLGLDARATQWALGNAATQACGLVEALGFDAKSLSVGNAARGGLLAALLAAKGFAGPEAPIEGERGLLAVMADQVDVDALVGDLGRAYEISLNTYKPYPCGVVLHPVIDACLELRARDGVRPDAIERVVVRGHPLLRQRADRPRVTTGREAQVCLRHTVGICLIDGAAGMDQYTDSRVADAAVRALGDKVLIEEDADIPVEAASVTLRLASGLEESCHVPHALGSLGRPLSDLDIDRKLAGLANHNAAGVDHERLIAAVWGLEGLADCSIIATLAAQQG